MTASARRWAAISAKLAVSAILVGILLLNVDQQQVAARVRQIDVTLFGASVALIVLLSLAHLLRWLLVLRALGASIPPAHVLAIIYVGYFFNQAMPSSIGGDAVRVWYVYRHGLPVRLALVSVLLDRAAALLGLLLIGVLLEPFYARMLGERIGGSIGLASVAFLGGGLLAFYLGTRFANLLPSRLANAVGALLEHGRVVLLSLRPGASTVSLSMLVHFGMGAAVYLIALSAGVPMSFGEGLLLFPIVNLVTMLPISLAGWGLREGAAIVILGLVGIQSSDALVLSLLFGVTQVLVSLPGGVLWIARHRMERLHAPTI